MEKEAGAMYKNSKKKKKSPSTTSKCVNDRIGKNKTKSTPDTEL